MKNLLIILIITISQSVFSQINYKPVFINQCTKEKEERVIWWVSDSIKNYGNHYLGMNYATLPKSGDYNLINSSVSSAPINLRIVKNNTTIKDTFYLKRLNAIITIKHPNDTTSQNYIPPKYFLCKPDSLANGVITDNYFNGNKREHGTFNNGKLIDTLFTYYRSGELHKLTIPAEDKLKVITYTKDGKIVNQ